MTLKSEENVLRDILIAQGLPEGTEPTPEAIRILSDYGYERYDEGKDWC